MGKPVLLQAVIAEGILGGSYNELGLIMESGLQSKGRQLNSNTQDTLRRSRNKPKSLRYHSTSPDTETEEAGCCSARTWKRILRIRLYVRGYAERSWLRHCVAIRKVAASLEFFFDNPSVRSMALGSTRHLHVPIVLKSGSLNRNPQSLSRSAHLLLSFFTTRCTAQNVTNADQSYDCTYV